MATGGATEIDSERHVGGMQENREVRLNFYFGEFRVFSKRLRVAFEPFTFDRPPLGSDTWPEPLADRELHGYFYPSTPAAEDLPVVSSHGGFLRYVPARFHRHYVDLAGDMDGYAKKFSGKTRSTLRRKVKKFGKLDDGNLDCRQYTTEDEIKEFYELARQISTKTYQERLLDAGLPEDAQFKDEMLALARENKVRGYLLFLKGEPISYLYLPGEDNRLIYSYLGYDPEYSKFSPGTVLQWLALERMFEEKQFAYYDFTEGEGAQKKQFGTDSVHCANVYYFKKTFGNRLTIWSHRALTGLSTGIVALLDKIGIKRAIKKWIRRSA